MYDNQANQNYSCIAKPYTSVYRPPSICNEVLMKWQCCLNLNKQEILVNDSTASRKGVIKLISFMQSFKCKTPKIMHHACHYFLQPM